MTDAPAPTPVTGSALAASGGDVTVAASAALGTVRVATASPAIDDQVDTGTDRAVDRPWDVVVWDDPVNLMSYVVWVFMRVFSYPEPVARKLMLEVHRDGKSLVASERREQAELYLQQLHGHGLQATIQRSR